jgi:hypothetical protein
MTNCSGKTLLLASLTLTLGMTACGGGGGGGGGGSNTGGGGTSGGLTYSGGPVALTTGTSTVSGVVGTGLVAGALVTATCAGTAIGSATTSTATGSVGSYTISLTRDCTAPVLLTATPPASGTMSVIDEFSGPQTVATGEAWTLRAYANLTPGTGPWTQPITPFSDMAAALVNKVGALTATTGIQAAFPVSTGLVTSAYNVITESELGHDPNGILSAMPMDPTTLNTSSPIAQQQLMVLLGAISVWANNVYPYPSGTAIPPTYTPPTATCGDPIVCGGSNSALAVLEAALLSQIGTSIAITDTPNSSHYVCADGSTSFCANGGVTVVQRATLPAFALIGPIVTVAGGTLSTTPGSFFPTQIETVAASTEASANSVANLLNVSAGYFGTYGSMVF